MRVSYGQSVHGKKEIKAVNKVLKRSTQMGKNVYELENKIAVLQKKYTEEHESYESIDQLYLKAKEDEQRKKDDLYSLGGAWSVDRKKLEAELESLQIEIKSIESKIRELLSDVAVFGTSKKLCTGLQKSISTQVQINEKFRIIRLS